MADNQFIITDAMVAGAETYVPLADKIAFAKVTAEECIERVEMTAQKMQSDEALTLPRMYQENVHMKQLYLMRFFLERYLHVTDPNAKGENRNEGWAFSTKEYDLYAGTHPLMQLDRFKFKGAPELRDKVFEILADYRETKKILETEIHNVLASRNDPLERFLAGITILSTPETVKTLVAQLKSKGAELDAAVKAKKARTKKEKAATQDEQPQ